MKNVIYQIECKNEWFLFSVSSTAKFGLVYVLTLENAFFRGFVLKPMKRAHVFLKHGTRDLQNGPPLARSASFYVTIVFNTLTLKQIFW